jgi:hypothetical protein
VSCLLSKIFEIDINCRAQKGGAASAPIALNPETIAAA